MTALRRNLLQAESLELPPLPYATDALEPVISQEIMTLHHDKHLLAYTNGYNAAAVSLETAFANGDAAAAAKAAPALNFNAGGYANHVMFFDSLVAPENYTEPSGALADAITQQFGDFDTFKGTFNNITNAIQGSGWGWLTLNPATHGLAVVTTANQDTVPSKFTLIPLLGIDVWEHAYYLQYLNARANYTAAIWDVINWPVVEERYAAASA